MNLRSATEDDRESIRDTARQSFRQSYGLSPQEVDTIVAEKFSPGAIGERTGGPERRLLLADGGHATVSGFAEVDARRTLRWLHVHPDDRGRGVGKALVERVRADGDDRSTSFTARVLERSREGGRFLEQFGLYWTDVATVEVGDLRFAEQIYTPEGRERTAGEPAVEVPDEVSVEGNRRRLRREEEIAGTVAPFYPLSGETERGGFFCSGCGATDVSTDALDRLECKECGNTHRPDDWDDAYL